MRILITGGAGFIGSHVADTYLVAEHEVAILDDFSSGKRSNVPSGTRVYEGSVTDSRFVQEVFQDFQPEAVNHHAAQISVVTSMQDPERDAILNVAGTVTVANVAAQTPSVRRFVYATSGGAMYGNPKQLPCLEITPAEPLSPYGLSKHTAERYVWLLLGSSPIKTTVLRYSNVYGPRQDPHGEAGVCAIFTGRMIKRESVTIFGDGTQVRDYVYVGDVARANLAALSYGEGESFNISTGVGTSTMEVYSTLRNATGYALDPQMMPERPGEVQAVILSPAKAKQGLSWEPEYTFARGIEATVAWYRETQLV